MGKGARNRQKRREADARRDGAMRVIGQLIEIEDWETFTALLESEPDALGPETLEALTAMGENEGYGASFSLMAELLANARSDPMAAWEEFARRRAEMIARSEQSEAIDAEITRAIEENRPDEVIELAQLALPEAKALGLGIAVSQLYKQLGVALIQTTSGDRAQNIEEAISALQESLSFALDDDWAADVAMHLGIAYGERIRGDRGRNVEEAVRLLHAVLANLSDETEPEMWAIARTNLASVLLRRENGDRVENLREAAALCEEALEYRSPERNAYDWAHTQLNLGVILQDLAALGEGDPADAEAAFRRVIDESGRIPAPWLIASAYYSLARMRRLDAHRSLEEMIEAEENDDPARDESRQATLEDAAELYSEASRLSAPAQDGVRHGRILSEFAQVVEELDRIDEAITLRRDANAYLRPTSAPRECAENAGALASLLADRGIWDEAAATVRDAVEAAALSFHTRLDTHAREDEAKRVGNLARWAAFMLAAVGDVREAALVLESGRTRELRRRLGTAGLAGELRALPEEARDAYMGALSELEREPLGTPGGVAARQLQEVLEAIREIPGFGDFATGASEAEFARAVEPGWPLVYVNPTPWGLQLLRVTGDSNGVTFDAYVDDRTTSSQMILRLLAGRHAELEDEEDLDQAIPGSYLFAISGHDGADSDATEEERRDMQSDLDSALPWLGEHVSKSIHDALASAHATGVTLVPCGAIGVAPLHAAPWSTAEEVRCLLDDFDVRFAPSALVAAVALERAGAVAVAPPTLLALADPTGDLPAAGPEVEELTRHFGGRARTASGRDASLEFLNAHVAEASHLHLACHARGGLFDPERAVIALSDGAVSALELAGLDVRARVTAVSACESGVADILHLPDEVFSVGTAMLAAGSACALVSLWPVLDLSAAMLMTRTYEEMFVARRRPPEALRQAQLWLRDLTFDETLEYLAGHPALEAEFRRRRGGGPEVSTTQDPEDRPYSHPDYWGAFIAMGA